MERPRHFSVGDWSVFPAEGLLVREPERKHLRPKTMDLLCLLAASPGRTMGKGTILDALWPDTAVEEGGVSRCVSELRAALEDDARRPRYIQTVPRRGYRIIARVAPLRLRAGRRHRARWLAAAVAVAILVTLSFVALCLQGESGEERLVALPGSGLTP
jgi:DNA-binding winged helix-turn-helix (wHTH) protein